MQPRIYGISTRWPTYMPLSVEQFRKSIAFRVTVVAAFALTPPPTPAAVDPVTIDPFIELRGAVWRTKAGIVFLKTPVGLLTLTSKTTLKDLKASQEVRFWVHERHSVVEIRNRIDGSLVHRY